MEKYNNNNNNAAAISNEKGSGGSSVCRKIISAISMSSPVVGRSRCLWHRPEETNTVQVKQQGGSVRRSTKFLRSPEPTSGKHSAAGSVPIMFDAPPNRQEKGIISSNSKDSRMNNTGSGKQMSGSSRVLGKSKTRPDHVQQFPTKKDTKVEVSRTDTFSAYLDRTGQKIRAATRVGSLKNTGSDLTRFSDYINRTKMRFKQASLAENEE